MRIAFTGTRHGMSRLKRFLSLIWRDSKPVRQSAVEYLIALAIVGFFVCLMWILAWFIENYWDSIGAVVHWSIVGFAVLLICVIPIVNLVRLSKWIAARWDATDTRERTRA